MRRGELGRPVFGDTGSPACGSIRAGAGPCNYGIGTGSFAEKAVRPCGGKRSGEAFRTGRLAGDLEVPDRRRVFRPRVLLEVAGPLRAAGRRVCSTGRAAAGT